MNTDDNNFYVTFSNGLGNVVDERSTVSVLFALYINRNLGRKRSLCFKTNDGSHERT